MNLAVELGSGGKSGFLLQSPVLTASGTFSYGLEHAKVFDIQRLGAIVAKTTTLEPRPGNPQPRTAETPAGMLNSIGLQNPGIDAVIRDLAPVWARWRVHVILSILGGTRQEYAEVAARVEGIEGISGLELNLSCPNIHRGGMEFGQEPDAAAEVTRAVRRVSSLPIIVKLTPNVTDIVPIARAAAEAGADALCLINTLRAMAIDVQTRRPALGSLFGGLSGPAIKPVALRMVYQVAGAVDVPVIGCGGIMNGLDAVEFLMAGASAVQVGTATFTNPRAPLDVLEGLEGFMREQGIEDVRELVGAARVQP